MRTLLIATLLLGTPGGALAQSGGRIAGRWVGSLHRDALTLDFYGDTMVVVNDVYAASYRASYDSLVVWGDTAFAATYWFSMDRLLLQTPEGSVVTMSRQNKLARPIQGLWRGTPANRNDVTVEIRMWRGGAARRRVGTASVWTSGEWSRNSRIITFTWLPDSTAWTAYYDSPGEALLFSETTPDLGSLVVRKVYR